MKTLNLVEEKTVPVRRVCAYCKKTMGWKQFPAGTPLGTETHGICPDCVEGLLAQIPVRN